MPQYPMSNDREIEEPALRVYRNDNTGVAVVSGFNYDLVIENARQLVCNGYIPVSSETCLYEHNVTGLFGRFTKYHLIKKANKCAGNEPSTTQKT